MLRVSDLYLPWADVGCPPHGKLRICRRLSIGNYAAAVSLGRKLGDDDGDEDDEAAEKLARAQRLMENDPAEEDGKDRFKLRIMLASVGGRAAGQDLQRVAHAAGDTPA